MSATRPIGESARRVTWLLAVTLVMSALSYTALQTRTGAWTGLWQRANLSAFTPDAGFAYSSPTGVPDQSSHDRPSAAAVYEDGRLLGPANASRESIQQIGAGRYAFWHDAVYFSASDNSDPARNGRLYVIAYPPVTRTMARTLYAVTALLLLASAAALAWLVHVAGARALGAAIADVARRLVELSPARPALDESRRRRIRTATIALWGVTIVLVAASETAFLTRTGQWTALWREAPVTDFRPEQGFAFTASTGRPEIGSQAAPQPTGLFENGVQLGLRNALHSEIREVGRGRYSFWHDYVIFATSDNSDPRTNGRIYVMSFPPISREGARLLYLLTLLVAALTAVVTWKALRSGSLHIPPAVAAFARRNALPLLALVAAGTLLLPALLRSSPAWSPLVDDLWLLVVLLQLAIAVVVRRWWGAEVPKLLRIACLAGLGGAFAIMTVWAPLRNQGCHTNGASYSVWTAYCVAPDSASYYMGYSVGSTRQPLYPWFIDAVTAVDQFDRRRFVDTVAPGAPRFHEDPLFRVVRAQVVLLLLAALIACAATMSLLGSTLPAVVFLWMYDQQYLGSAELNMILTETLVQTFQVLLFAAFAAFLARQRPRLVIAAALAAGLAYLTRQASAYSALLFLFVVGMAALAGLRRRWQWCAAAGVTFALIVAVPDIYAFATTGNLGKQQESLQYQYRIAHAMQYATLDDLALMPDEDSREWLRAAIGRRDAAHRALEAKFAGDEYSTLVYYVNDNLYVAAIPPGEAGRTPEFYMAVATPILVKHWTEYARFAFRFWMVALERPQVSRLGFFGFSPWFTYAALFALAAFVGGSRGLAGVTLVLCHWAAVALACLFAAPIPRMVWASEFLVVLSALLLIWTAGERIAAMLRRRPQAHPSLSTARLASRAE